MTKKERADMIKQLVIADHELIEGDTAFLTDILLDGFIGYNQRTDAEIKEAYDDRKGRM